MKSKYEKVNLINVSWNRNFDVCDNSHSLVFNLNQPTYAEVKYNLLYVSNIITFSAGIKMKLNNFEKVETIEINNQLH